MAVNVPRHGLVLGCACSACLVVFMLLSQASFRLPLSVVRDLDRVEALSSWAIPASSNELLVIFAQSPFWVPRGSLGGFKEIVESPHVPAANLQTAFLACKLSETMPGPAAPR